MSAPPLLRSFPNLSRCGWRPPSLRVIVNWRFRLRGEVREAKLVALHTKSLPPGGVAWFQL